ncbi:MAG: protein kinase, partial [Isosphaeraceae bacterium]|nr:protein kinase [Isosphaeraceae bacterium]
MTFRHPPVLADNLPLCDRIQIDLICDRFEKAWRAGEGPNLGTFLADFPGGGPARAELLRELLILDLEFRRAGGEPTDALDYRERFPEHADIVSAALASSVVELALVASGSPAEVPTVRLQSAREILGPSALAALRSAGYEVGAELGRGGMGIVFQATQIALNRPVALKVVRSGAFVTEAERRRFRNEAEAVALLDHPHIVPVYEVGERRGQPFFSMKLITGSSLDKRLGAYATDPRAMARLVAVLAEAGGHPPPPRGFARAPKPPHTLVGVGGVPHLTPLGRGRRGAVA